MIERHLPSMAWIGWTAGIIDGEGSIAIVLRKRKKEKYYWESYDVRVTVSSTTKEMLEKLKELWGGSYRLVKRVRPQRQPCYHYACVSREALILLENVFSYLTVKRERAELAISLQRRISAGIGTNHRWRKMELGERQIRHQMYLDMKNMSGKVNYIGGAM